MQNMKYDIHALVEYCTRALIKVGVPEEDAATVASVLANADARGVHSHGVVRMEGYVECVMAGGIAPAAEHTIITEGDSHARIDANRGLGIPVSVFAAKLAKRKAQKSGIAIVNVYNSHHHGACGYYTLMCADDGLIGMAMSTGDIIMAVTGAATSSIGNNPFSYAVPAGKYRAICYDIAMSTVAAGKISMAAVENRSIPLGWLLDPAGNPTTDPHDYERGGALAPFGGYKGYGLSIMVEALAGVLSGAALLKDIHAWNKDPDTSGNVGHCFIAMDPTILHPEYSVSARAEQMIDELLHTPKAPGVDRILFPGELENENEKLAYKQGIALPYATEHALQHVAEMTGIPFSGTVLAAE